MSTPAVGQRSRAWIVATAGCVAALTILAVLVSVRWHPLITVDVHAVRSAHEAVTTHHWLEQLSRFVTRFGAPLVVTVLTVVGAAVAAFYRRWRIVVFIVAVRLIELGVTTLVKDLVDRPRPTFPDPVAHAAGNSFPSGHAAGAAAIYGALALALLSFRKSSTALTWVLGSAVVVLVAAVAASRVLLGVHYPSDVTAGILVGVGSIAAVKSVMRAT